MKGLVEISGDAGGQPRVEYPGEELPGGVTVTGPKLAQQVLFQFEALTGHRGPNPMESAVTAAGLLEGEPVVLNMTAECFANIVLTGCEVLGDLGLGRFRAMWNAARRLHPSPGLATESAAEKGAGI